MKYEFRWLDKTKNKRYGPQYVLKLQYRYSLIVNSYPGYKPERNYEEKWSDWQDVPVIEETPLKSQSEGK